MTHRRPNAARHFRRGLPGMVGVAAIALQASLGSAQTSSMPATLRYGSGLLNIPAASVLPHLVVTGTYSGFVDRLDEDGGESEPFDRWFSGGSAAIGLFGRAELGATLRHFTDADEGGMRLGAFGRLSVLPAAVRLLDVAVGARYVRSTVSPYVVATARLPGFEAGPDYDVTLTAGWGGGMFSAGGDLDFHSARSSRGLFAGSAINLSIGSGRLVNLMVEYNGFDANAGVQVDFGGIRAGAFSLGLGSDGTSVFRTRKKFGILGSVAFCGGEGGLCSPGPDEPAPDTVVLPAPPPDTVVIERASPRPLPAGTPATLCLATGVEVDVVLTAAGDTLVVVGPSRIAVSDLRPGVGFAGNYAGGEEWFARGAPVTLDERSYERRGEQLRLDCGDIVRIGAHEGVPIFAERNGGDPYDVVYVPVAPGLWRSYRFRSPPSATRPREHSGRTRPRRFASSGVRSSAVSMSDCTSRHVTRAPVSRARAAVSRSTVSVLHDIPVNRAGCRARRPMR